MQVKTCIKCEKCSKNTTLWLKNLHISKKKCNFAAVNDKYHYY